MDPIHAGYDGMSILEASSLPLHQRGPNAISLYTIALKKNLLFL
jgi:hypothetical protein